MVNMKKEKKSKREDFEEQKKCLYKLFRAVKMFDGKA